MATKIFFASGEDPKMMEAFKKAQDTFKYFWRELSWEYRRIVPALEVACVKVAFSQETADSDSPLIEHMWINEINYNGETISGVLLNDPNELTNINKGDTVEISPDQISDWLIATRGRTYGGFTIQVMRSEMSDEEREEHDEAWGLDFGDYNDVLLVFEQKEHPGNLEEHPMSRNMRESLMEFVKNNPNELSAKDEAGNSFLHREVIAGNRTSVEVLKMAGAQISEQNHFGKTPLDYALQLGWDHIIPLLVN